jgi:hypothetical protein
MKYSLRSLMIVVTLVCVALGVWAGRVEYLRRMATFHDQEARRCAMQIKEETGWNPLALGFTPLRIRNGLPLCQLNAHQDLAIEYRNAVSHPWLTIKSPSVPMTEEEAQERVAKLVDERLGRLPTARVAVTGRVTYFGRPVAGASVMLTGKNSLFDGRSDFDGRFQLKDQTDSPNSVPPGQYTLCVSVPGNDTNGVPPFVWDRWAKTPWHKTHISPALAQELDIQLESP